jgi:hypothetical protein
MQADVEAWIKDHALQRLHHGARTKGLCTTNEELRIDVASQKMADINDSFDGARGGFGGGSASMGGGSVFHWL